jgi:hypothetical protein
LLLGEAAGEAELAEVPPEDHTIALAFFHSSGLTKRFGVCTVKCTSVGGA